MKKPAVYCCDICGKEITDNIGVRIPVILDDDDCSENPKPEFKCVDICEECFSKSTNLRWNVNTSIGSINLNPGVAKQLEDKLSEICPDKPCEQCDFSDNGECKITQVLDEIVKND